MDVRIIYSIDETKADPTGLPATHFFGLLDNSGHIEIGLAELTTKERNGVGVSG